MDAPRPPSDRSQGIFEQAYDIIKEYEIARREHMIDPQDEEKNAAFLRTVAHIDSLWCHQRVGNLTREASLLVDFHIGMLEWETNASIRDFESDVASPTNVDGE